MFRLKNNTLSVYSNVSHSTPQKWHGVSEGSGVPSAGYITGGQPQASTEIDVIWVTSRQVSVAAKSSLSKCVRWENALARSNSTTSSASTAGLIFGSAPTWGERSSSRKATPQAYRFVHVRASRPDRCSVNLRAAEGICLRVSFRLLPTPHGSGPRRRTSSPRYMGLRHLRTSNRHHLERARRRGRCRPGGRQEMQVVWNPYDSPRSTIRRLSFPVVGPVGWLVGPNSLGVTAGGNMLLCAIRSSGGES